MSLLSVDLRMKVMGTPLATAIACCVAERERGIWMTRYMKE